jgi:hypothetical protein
LRLFITLIKDGTQEEMGGNRIPIQTRTDNGDHRNQHPCINHVTYAIPVIIKGLTSVETNKNIYHKFKKSAQEHHVKL